MADSAAMTSGGTIISMANALPATYNEAGFEALTLVELGEIGDGGTYGKSWNPVNYVILKTRKTIKRKGSFDNGDMTLQLARAPSDAGQALALAALDLDTSSSFSVELQDGTINYFTAQVLSYVTNVGTADSITTATITLAIDDDIIEVAAT